MTDQQPPTIAEPSIDAIANELLTLIEGREVRSLSWGFTDVRQDLDRDLDELVEDLGEAFGQAWAEQCAIGMANADLLQNLIERKLIFRASGLYRTRFAETVRLLSLLRQRFSHDDWITGRTLIGDYRLALSRRRYPRRDVDASEVLDELKMFAVDARRIDAVASLLRHGTNEQLTLASFQSQAIVRMLRNLKSRHERGVVIGAGTGSGKTKAFYIPALAEIAAGLSDERFVQALALYPRNELLKDQFVEAFSESRRLDAVLKERDTRPISIGAYYGDTPYSADYLERSLDDPTLREFWAYDSRLRGWLCPFLRCPNDRCGRESLVWSRVDVHAERLAISSTTKKYGDHEVLRCPDCGFATPPHTVQLTRESMREVPPDILFTSTETLNRSMANVTTHALFGINVEKPPRLMLLDEIHTYAGVFGAQVAYLLRRWRFGRATSRDNGCCIVGLSATLTNAESFFSKLTGLPEHVVEYITPAHDEMIEEGAEYNVVVKNDVSSGASLLSTSVQTTMLLGRVLDPMSAAGKPSRSRGAIGQRMFAFTDSLDVINRWYDIAVNAETGNQLSQYRLRDRTWSPEHYKQRNAAGQVWWMSTELGHDLTKALELERTSSQDRGVSRAAQLVIATSTLEVGFNDPTIGAIVQHKAPRNLASFMQRKGRGGRVRSMRPWTVVVTSGFGRDRWAFQHAEQLFDSILPPIHLPLNNEYVRKIQASFALMDWLALMLAKRNFEADVWDVLTNKQRQTGRSEEFISRRRSEVTKILKGVLDGALADNLTLYLANALNLDPNSPAVRGLLWNDPRSIMFDLIPTVIRQLESDWSVFGDGKRRDTPSTYPIPHYVPKALFNDLNLPQLEIEVPFPKRYGQAQPSRIELMSISSGMREFAPGHARKRFIERDRTGLAHWLPVNVPETNDKAVFELSGSRVVTTNQPIAVIAGGEGSLAVYKPLRYQLQVLPQTVDPTTSGRLRWSVEHVVHGEFSFSDGDHDHPTIDLRPMSPLRTFISDIQYFLHENGSWADVIRYAPAVDMVYKAKFRKGVPRSAEFRRDGQSAALGFAIEADAMRFQLKPLDVDALRSSRQWPRLYRVLGANFFKELLLRDPRLAEEEVSAWDVEWLWQVELAAITATAIVSDLSLEEACHVVDKNRINTIQRTLKTIFQAQQDESGDETEDHGRRYHELMQLEEKINVISALQDLRTVLWDDSHPALNKWLIERHRASLAAALTTSVVRFVDDIDPDDLLFDVSGSDVWISEAAPGGVGLVSRIAQEMHRQPRQFDLAFLGAIQSCEREQNALQLERICQLLEIPDSELERIFASVRRTGDLTTIERLARELTVALESSGIATNRALFVALNSKFLRPNSGPDSDKLVASVVRLWKREAERLQIHIDVRTISVAATKQEETADALDLLLNRVDSSMATENQRFNLLQSLLWERCVDSCPACIQAGHMYADNGYVSRHLLSAQLTSAFVEVTFGTPNWQLLLKDQLIKHLEVRLLCAQDQLEACTAAVLDGVLVEPIDFEYQFAHAAIDRVTREGTMWMLHFVVPDLIST